MHSGLLHARWRSQRRKLCSCRHTARLRIIIATTDVQNVWRSSIYTHRRRCEPQSGATIQKMPWRQGVMVTLCTLSASHWIVSAWLLRQDRVIVTPARHHWQTYFPSSCNMEIRPTVSTVVRSVKAAGAHIPPGIYRPITNAYLATLLPIRYPTIIACPVGIISGSHPAPYAAPGLTLVNAKLL